MKKGLDRADVDDPPFCRAELIDEGMGDVEDPAQIDADDIVPVLRHVIRVRGESVPAVDAGIVHEDRGLADFLGDLARQLAALVAVCDIELEAPCFAALVEDLLHDRGRAFEVVVEDNDVGAFFCIAFCNGLSRYRMHPL